MGKSYGVTKIHEIKDSDIEFFCKWLMGGEDPERFTFTNKPYLNETDAEFIIQYLRDNEYFPCGKEKVLELKEISIDNVDEIYSFLKRFMDEDNAFSVIYYLQEHFEVLPDNIEQCKVCKDLFDLDYEGTCINEDTVDDIGIHFDKEDYGLYCDYCRPD